MDQQDHSNSKARQAEVESLLRAECRYEFPWLSEWQIEEILPRELERFGPEADPALVAQHLDRKRSERDARAGRNFGPWLQRQLRKRGWNQSDLARRIDSHPSLVSKWIRGMQRPQPRQCERLALVFNINTDVVLDAAGHISLVSFADEAYVHDVLAASSIRHEILQILNDVPEPLLAPLVPLLRTFADPAVFNPLLAQMSESLGRISAVEEYEAPKQEDNP